MGTMHELAVMDSTGDTKTMWDRDNEVEVEMAKENFKKLKKKGYQIFHVSKGGDKGKQMLEFDPDAEKMIAVPAVVGG